MRNRACPWGWQPSGTQPTWPSPQGVPSRTGAPQSCGSLRAAAPRSVTGRRPQQRRTMAATPAGVSPARDRAAAAAQMVPHARHTGRARHRREVTRGRNAWGTGPPRRAGDGTVLSRTRGCCTPARADEQPTHLCAHLQARAPAAEAPWRTARGAPCFPVLCMSVATPSTAAPDAAATGRRRR